jgi:hypothetical protein
MSNYEKVKEWRKNNPEKVAAQNKRYNTRNPDVHKRAAIKYRQKNLEQIREKEKLAARASRKNNPEAQRIRNENWRIRHEARLWDRAGRPRANECEICDSSGITVFDHCHSTDKFRGWVCDRCNKVLGLIKDSADLLRKLANYLENFDDSLNDKETQCVTKI